ncbi:MAG: DNA mismatch repair endonuclease MutL [Deltaproteobacteria bacterium]|nr:DNA mismatch repair endonuclease MutL [Deltaproteobacteria bacterium]
MVSAPEPRIRVLPPELADQIAAGEVVERPASVVKELCENAIDAGARRIVVDVEGGGRRLIRVVDDGCGMTPEEARLALRRHATSKLRSLEDLFTLTTMGFRGEALPSIAAVSRLALTTRTLEQVAGFRLEVDAGIERYAQETGAPPGTQVEVRDLLFNVPARLKFLKADATESSHITESMTRLAIAHPEVHFKLRHGGKVSLDVPPHASLLERVREILGKRLAMRLHESEHEEAGIHVVAFLAPPDEAQSTSRGLQLYVGRRSVRDRGLFHAVVMGHAELVPQGRYPTAIVMLEPVPGSVDINVHPQKTEVRFARPQEIYSAVRHAVASAVARAPWLAESPGSAPTPVSMYAVASHSPPPPLPLRVSDVGASYAEHQEELLLGVHGASSAGRSAPGASRSAFSRAIMSSPVQAGPGAPEPLDLAGSFFSSLSYLGQLDRTYLVCESAGELVLLDQHAAHERIAFQRLRKAHAEHRPPTQRLLFPRTFELGASHAAAAAEHGETLSSIGFEIAPFGGSSWALTAAPADLRDDEVIPTLTELLGDLADHGLSRAAEGRVDAMLATIACHSVVRAGDVLSVDEAKALLGSLDGVDFKAHCPHGRPVLLRISVAEIARRFGRT